MDAWATAADLARLYAVTRQTIRRWATEDHWQTRGAHPKTYRWDDAQTSYEKRHLLKNRLVKRHQDTIDHIAGRP